MLYLCALVKCWEEYTAAIRVRSRRVCGLPLVGMDDNQPVDGTPAARDESEINALLKQITTENPALLGKIQAVPVSGIQ